MQTLVCRQYRQEWGVTYPQSLRIVRIGGNFASSFREYLGFVRQVLARGNAEAAFFVGHDMHGLFPARILATRYRRPLVYHCHDFVEAGRKLTTGTATVKLLERFIARTANLVIVPDRDRAKIVAKQLKLRRFPLIVANAARQCPNPAENVLSMALSERGKHWTHAVLRQGGIGIGHSVEATLKSIPDWDSHDWGFVLLGPVPNAYRTIITELAASLGVSDRFALLPQVKYDDVSKFTVGAALGHALYDPIHINNRFIITASNKIMEYMAAGIPLLLPGTPESHTFLAKYPCGITAMPNEPKSIAKAVNTILKNPATARQMGQVSVNAFKDEFNYRYQFAPALEQFQEFAGCKSWAEQHDV